MNVFPPQVWREKETLYRLIGGKCNCGNVIFPYSPVCNKCGSTSVSKIKLSGKGILLQYTVTYQHRPGFEKTQPTYVGLIKLQEGPEIIAPLTDVDEGELKEGDKVEAVIRRIKSDSNNGLIVYGTKFRLIKDGDK
ncbi:MULTISPECIES: Zn-ribbon domain-containing OB-fold protein [Acidianus]|uniref:DNA-binding protein n=1 Tax=Candidatus Acidianus copahuensis TaxID=1160895 RepID=A0A031LQB3_9CREN|nr:MULTISPECIES: Zn-ribbon domain-containing OB-fold protein [Acidianus]EZQ06920.1 DNA-binding protein [Candidatus Acidianus copahuensis]NON62555.1 Zn-ribbon domain-containing OB-fold protein [Acidianus sp. RZ1]